MKHERDFQPDVIKALYERFPGCIVLKNDPAYLQGIPDLSVFYKDRWAMLEVKDSADAPYRPNQEFYLKMCNDMSYGATIYPENMEDILNDLQQTFEPRRKTRSARSK